MLSFGFVHISFTILVVYNNHLFRFYKHRSLKLDKPNPTEEQNEREKLNLARIQFIFQLFCSNACVQRTALAALPEDVATANHTENERHDKHAQEKCACFAAAALLGTANQLMQTLALLDVQIHANTLLILFAPAATSDSAAISTTCLRLALHTLRSIVYGNKSN